MRKAGPLCALWCSDNTRQADNQIETAASARLFFLFETHDRRRFGICHTFQAHQQRRAIARGVAER